jgi:site-specific recombinase XerD
MVIINWIVNYRRFLKRRNYSPHTIKNYMSTLRRFVLWLDVPVEQVMNKKILQYIDVLLDHNLQPKTINCHLDSIRGFYEYLRDVEDISIPNPVKRGYALRLSRPLPRYLRDEEVADLSLRAMDLKRRKIAVEQGKGGKGRVVYISNDALNALVQYFRVRPSSRAKKLFLVEKGPYSGKAISVRGIQKRIEYYALKAQLKVSSHQLRHTMATQLLNADADLVPMQDLLGHCRIKTTQRYCKVSNLKVQRDYFKAMEEVMQRTL